MADTRISALTAITAAETADADLLPIVDTSAGSNRKMTFGEARTALSVDAVAARTAAEAAQLAAETARDAAQLAAGVYDTTAAGLAATVSGEYFTVPSGRAAEALILYKNNAGAALEIKRYPAVGFRRYNRLAICGASIVNRASYANTANQGFAFHNWLEWLQALAGQPFQIVSMAGEGGRQITVVDTNFDTEVLAYSPDVVILGNDAVGNYLYSVGAPTAASALAYVESIYNKCVAAGAELVMFLVPPNVQLNATNDASLDRTYRTFEYNRLAIEFAATHPGFTAIEFNDHVDLAATGQRYNTTLTAGLATTAWTHDGTHPHPKLSIKLAQLLHAALAGKYPTPIFTPHAANVDIKRALANPLNYGTGGTNGAGNSNSSTHTCTEEARTDIGDGGAWKNISVAAIAASPVYTFAGVGSIPANMTAGTTPIRALVEIKLNAVPTNLRGFKLTLSFAGTAVTIGGFNTTEAGGSAQLANAGPFIPVGETLWLSTAIDELPAGATNFSLAIEATKYSGGNLTVDFSVGRAIIEPVGTTVPFVAFSQTTP